MTDMLEGYGYLFQEDRLVARVRYRLRWATDDWGQSQVEGELCPGCKGGLVGHANRYVMHTESGFSVPLEVEQPHGKDWMPFHRVGRKEAGHEMG